MKETSHGVWCHRPAQKGKPDSDRDVKEAQVIDRRIATTRERLTHVFWGRPRMRILRGGLDGE